MDAVIRGTTMPVLEVHLTPGESVVAESGQLGWFDDGIELETSTAMAGAGGVWGAGERRRGCAAAGARPVGLVRGRHRPETPARVGGCGRGGGPRKAQFGGRDVLHDAL